MHSPDAPACGLLAFAGLHDDDAASPDDGAPELGQQQQQQHSGGKHMRSGSGHHHHHHHHNPAGAPSPGRRWPAMAMDDADTGSAMDAHTPGMHHALYQQPTAMMSPPFPGSGGDQHAFLRPS